MRDMLDGSEPYPLTAWQAQFRRMRTDLEDAMAREAQLSPLDRDAGAAQVSERLAGASSGTRSTASSRWPQNGQEAEARTLIRLSLQARQEALSTAVARLLVQNNESEQQAGARIRGVYAGVERNVYLFVAAMLVLILLTSLYLVQYNRRLFQRGGGAFGAPQRTGAATDLHAGKHLPLHLARTARRFRPDPDGHRRHAAAHRPAAGADPDSVRADLREVQEIVQSTLDKVRVAFARAAPGDPGRDRPRRRAAINTCPASRSRPALKCTTRSPAPAASWTAAWPSTSTA